MCMCVFLTCLLSFSVNLGGWLVLEPFISPAMYEPFFPNAVDEWTLSQNMRADTARGGIQQLEDHYKTFIVRVSVPVPTMTARACF